jgi:hypothetical protein
MIAARTLGGTAQSAVGTAAFATNKWLYWFIPAASVAAFLIHLLANPTEQVAQQGVTVGQSLVVGGFNIDKQVTDSIAGLPTLGGITDAASVQAALPRLQEVVGGQCGQLSAEQRKLLAGIVSSSLPTLNQLLDKVLGIPGVAEVLKPTIDTLKSEARCFDCLSVLPGSSAPVEHVGYQDCLRARIREQRSWPTNRVSYLQITNGDTP